MTALLSQRRETLKSNAPIQMPVLKAFEGSSWHFCHHSGCQHKGLQPVAFYAVFGSQWRYFCNASHVPYSLQSPDGLVPTKPKQPRTRNTTRKPGRQTPQVTKASQCEIDILKALQAGPQAKQLICGGIKASTTRIDTVLRRLWVQGQLTRVALGKRNTHLWYALAEHKEELERMIEPLKRAIPVGPQRQRLLQALESGPQTAAQLAKSLGWTEHKVMYTTQALARLQRITSITSYADLNWFALPADREALVEAAWLASTDYKVLEFVRANPGTYTRRIAGKLGISFVRAKRILEFARSFNRVSSKTDPNNHTRWIIQGCTAVPLDLGTV